MIRLTDQGDRGRAATDFGTNLVVTAGAGTGKTSLLIERILNGCLGQGFDLHSVMAITFTEKAAAEMRDRLSFALERIRGLAMEGGEPNREKSGEADRAWEHLRVRKGIPAVEIGRRSLVCLEQLDDAVVTTIHALCVELLRRHPRQAGVDPTFKVDDGSVAARLSDPVWEEWLASELGPDARRADLWRAVLPQVDLGTLKTLARGLANSPAPLAPGDLLESRRTAESSLKDLCRETAGSVRGILERATGIRARMEKQLEICWKNLSRVAEEGTACLPDDFGFPTKTPGPSPGNTVSGVSPEEVLRVGRQARELLEGLSEVGDLPHRCLDLLAPYTGEFRARFEAEGYLSFSDLLLRARNLLRDHPEVREREKGRIRSLLVDEFQDTDPLQYEIVFFLAESEGCQEGDPFRTKLEPGKLFIVGDPKQSIYRFRGADIEAYEKAVERVAGDGGRILRLTSNFRSPGEILSPLNHLFQEAFRSSSEQQASYEEIRAALGDRGDPPRVAIWSISPGEGKADAGTLRRREGRVIARWISETLPSDRFRFRDVAILFQAMSSLNLYLRPLREAGIPFVVEGGRTFGERPEVLEFLSLLKVLANPNDGVALLAVLRSPIGGVTDVELARNAACDGGWALHGRIDAGRCPDLAGTLEHLRALRGRIRHLPVDAAVRAILEETHLLELNAAAYEGGQRVANLMRLADRVGCLAREEHLSLNETVRTLERKFEEETVDPESPLADEALDAVRLLTVHKAKGLEFPIVILPDLLRQGQGLGETGSAIEWVGIGGGRKGIAIRIRTRSGKQINEAEWVRHHMSRAHTVAERIRTFYVACTRAKDRLILVSSRPKRSAPWIDCLRAWGYSWRNGDPPVEDSLHHGEVGLLTLHPPATLVRVESRSFCPEEVDRSVERFEAARRQAESRKGRRWMVSPTGLEEEGLEEVSPLGAPLDSPVPHHSPRRWKEGKSAAVAAAAGVAVHWLLQVWDRRDPRWLLEHTREAAVRGASRTGADPQRVSETVRDILRGFLASDLLARLQEVEVIGREVPFEAADGTRLLRGVIDLVYRSGGDVVIADFKTDEVSTGQEEGLLGKYQHQMSAYGRAVQRALGLPGPPRREIWSVRTGRVVTYPRSDP